MRLINNVKGLFEFVGEGVGKYYPPLYKKVKETDEIIKVEDKMFLELSSNFGKALSNQWVMSSDEDTITNYENLLEIKRLSTSETIEFRRGRVLNRLSLVNVLTEKFLAERFNEIAGIGNYTIKYRYPSPYQMVISTNINDADVYKEMYITLYEIVPANVDWVVNTNFTDHVVLEELVKLTDIYKNYVLGFWKVGEKPFQTREGRIITSMETKTLNIELSSAILGWMQIKPFKATIYFDGGSSIIDVLGGDVIINTEYSDYYGRDINLLEVTYLVPYDERYTKIEKVDLVMNVSGVGDVPVSSNLAFIPKAEDLLLTHKIFIGEGAEKNG